MAVFPWERDDSKPPSRGRGRAATPQAPPADHRGGSQPQPRDRGRTEDVSKEADGEWGTESRYHGDGVCTVVTTECALL